MSTKVAVVYYSATGSVAALADAVVDGARGTGAEVRLRKVHELAPAEAIASNPRWAAYAAASTDVPEATPDDILWADAVIFGTPTRFGNVSAQLKQFLDTLGGLWGQGKLADKVYSGFVSTSTMHGGRETTLQAIYVTAQNFGGIIVTPGYTDPIQLVTGTPYGPSHTDGGGVGPSEDTLASARYSGRRVASITAQLLAGRTAS